jgi:HNH endonuclease
VSVEERFWAKVEKTDDCWLWTGAFRRNGYGAFKLDGHVVATHRLSYELGHGAIAEGLLVLHTCDIRACVNPKHLFLGSYLDNTLDAMKKGRHHYATQPKLTASDVMAIRRLYATGKVGYKRLAHEYGVDFTTIRDIIKGEAWRDAA